MPQDIKATHRRHSHPRAALSQKRNKIMNSENRSRPTYGQVLLCIGCGKPSTKGEFCRECLDRGLGPCEACEGLSLLDVEEQASFD
jgi:hypothetical protein